MSNIPILRGGITMSYSLKVNIRFQKYKSDVDCIECELTGQVDKYDRGFSTKAAIKLVEQILSEIRKDKLLDE